PLGGRRAPLRTLARLTPAQARVPLCSMMQTILTLLLLALQEPPKESVQIPGTKLKFELVALPGGKAVVGSPPDEPNRKEDERRREVELKPFRLAVREVTWAEFNAFRNSKDLDGVTRPT